MEITNLLDEDEVRTRLASYTDEKVTDELYKFGEILLQDAVDRIGKSDSTAFAIAAYCGGVIAVVVSSATAWRANFDSWALFLVVSALVLVSAAGVLAIYSTTPRKTEWFSSNEWMSKECLTGSDRLKRYYVLGLWGVLKDHQARYRTRVGILIAARWILTVAGFLLLLAFFDVAWWHSPL